MPVHLRSHLTTSPQLLILSLQIEPEHDADGPCNCDTHRYQRSKISRQATHKMWSKAVKYPGETTYNDFYTGTSRPALFSGNPYWNVTVPYSLTSTGAWGGPATVAVRRPNPLSHAKFIRETLALNNKLNQEAQAKVDALEPNTNIWGTGNPVGTDVASGPAARDNNAKPGDAKSAEGDGYAWTQTDQKAPAYDAKGSAEEEREI